MNWCCSKDEEAELINKHHLPAQTPPTLPYSQVTLERTVNPLYHSLNNHSLSRQSHSHPYLPTYMSVPPSSSH